MRLYNEEREVKNISWKEENMGEIVTQLSSYICEFIERMTTVLQNYQPPKEVRGNA